MKFPMMKSLTSTLLICISFTAAAQEFSNKNLQQMVDAERAFARMAKEQNRRDAFLFYLSDDVITSGPNGPQKGKTEIEKQPVTNDLLTWEVAFCDIAASGDFGYNTGPYEYRGNKTDDQRVSFGQFNSVWKKQSDGSWKNVLDIGTRHREPHGEIKLTTSLKPAVVKAGRKKKSEGNDFLDEEKKFLEAAKENAMAAYQKYLSSESRIVHTGKLPLITLQEKEQYLQGFKWPDNVQLISGESASSNDLAFVYGTAEMRMNQSPQKFIATYVRIWKREGSDWKIVLDVLSY